MNIQILVIPYNLKFSRVKVFEDLVDFCLASKILVFQGHLLKFFLLVQTQYVGATNILSTHNFVDLQNRENFTMKISF